MFYAPLFCFVNFLFVPMERRGCKVCGRSFPSGRALGGHMRSHVALSSCLDAEEKVVSRYRLRENPKKSWRLSECMLCSKCGKGFGSWNSLFEHIKCRSQISRGVVDEKEENLESNGSQSYNEVTAIALPVRRRRSSLPVAAISAASSQPAEYEKEQEDGAFCLLMLSRGPGSVTDSSDKASVLSDKDAKSSKSDFPTSGIRINGLKRDHSLPSESGFSFDGDQDVNFSSERKILNSAVAESNKRCRYQCTTCNKSFNSYQALGGHLASHKKIKGGSFESPPTEEPELHNSSSQTDEGHECSICGKVFASGQALGGHKRSHFVAANNAASAAGDGGNFSDDHAYHKASKLTLVDLNLPAPDDESSYNSNGSN